jgi:diguanylate cyclase (GGDEF)-like protein
MADLDHVKRFNDEFGHEAGDLVLKEVGGMLREAFRTIDVPCRLGGEELAVLLPDADVAAVSERVERLLAAIRSRDLVLRSQQLGRVTMSAGLAAFPEHAGSATDLAHAADRALYEAKHGGRDRVVVAS